MEHHVVASDFAVGLANSGSAIYFSQLLRVELLQALRKIGTDPNGLRESVRRKNRLQHWGRIESVRENWLRFGLSQFDTFLIQFRAAYELAMTPEIVASAVGLMARHNLKSNDAVHLATARAAGVTQIVTLDRDFSSVTQPSVLLLQS